MQLNQVQHLLPEEADATVAEPTGTEAAENQEEIAN
jgi:hypothetical protein